MMHSKKTIKKNLQKVLLGTFAFLVCAFSVHAQVSMEPLHITQISAFEPYTSINPDGGPGICLLATVFSPEATNIQMRTAPYSTIDNPVWSYNPFVIDIDPNQNNGINLSFNSNLQPATKYIIQMLEVDPDGVHHIITPSNTLDDMGTICTPNSNGTINNSCQPSTEVLVECSTSDANQAMQLSGGDNIPGTVSIENITPSENSVSFVVNTENINSGSILPIIYSSNLQAVLDQDSQSVLYTTNGGNVTVEITGLQNNTTYYMSALDQSGMNIINTASNLSYESFATGVQSNTTSGTNSGLNSNNITGLGVAETININIDGTLDTSQLAGENIEQGFTQCGYGDTYDCDFNQLLATIDRIIKFMLYVIVLPLAAILFAWSGIKIIIEKSQGKQAALADAKAMFGRVLLGIVFAMGAWVIVKFILVILGYTDASGIITQILGITTTQ